MVLQVLFHPKQLTLVTSGDDADVRVWDLVSKSCVAVLKVTLHSLCTPAQLFHIQHVLLHLLLRHHALTAQTAVVIGLSALSSDLWHAVSCCRCAAWYHKALLLLHGNL